MRGPEPREFKQIARRRQQSVSVLRIEFDRSDYQNGLMCPSRLASNMRFVRNG
jgi:hypothetical protein